MQQTLPITPAPQPYALRDYQQQVVDEWDKSITDRIHCTLLVASTGAGKTQMASEIVHKAIKNDWRVMFVVHRDVLVSQSWTTFKRHGLHCGFIKAGWEQDLEAPVQIASIQTLLKRSHLLKKLPTDLVIWDEAHITTFSSIWDKVTDHYPNAYHLGLTATPWRLSKKEGLGDKFDNLISAPMMSELIKQGHLCRPVYYGLPEVDLTGVATVQGDYNESQLALKCDRSELINEIVDEWFRLARDRRTIAFAVSVEHSKHIAQVFCDRGVSAVSITADTPIHIRKEYYAKLAASDIKVISSVGVLSEGFDCPSVDCILMCRPTKSKAFHFQSIGRGLRTAPNKKNCIVLDQSGNIKRHGFVESLTKRGIQLKKGKDNGPGDPFMKTCGSKGEDAEGNEGCGCLVLAFKMTCPECGYLFPPKETIKHLGELKLLLCDERLELYDRYQADLRDYFKRDRPLSEVDEAYYDEHGEYPDSDWSYAALFGDEPTLANALKLQKYCDRHDTTEPMLAEFGHSWEDRMHEARSLLDKGLR